MSEKLDVLLELLPELIVEKALGLDLFLQGIFFVRETFDLGFGLETVFGLGRGVLLGELPGLGQLREVLLQALTQFQVGGGLETGFGLEIELDQP